MPSGHEKRIKRSFPVTQPHRQQTMNCYNFSADQQSVFDRIIAAVNDLDNPIRLFVSGTAGTGKSYLIKALIDELGYGRVSVCAPTGMAAKLVEGRTIHSLCKLAVVEEGEEKNPDDGAPAAKKSRRDTGMRLFIIDEISMCSAELLDNLEKDLSSKRKDRGPFGGFNIVAFGDLYQIPPVKAKWVFKSELWKTHFQYAELNSNHRQQADPEFAQMLQRFRVGELTDLDRAFLKSRVVPNQAGDTFVACTADAYNKTAKGQALILLRTNKVIQDVNNEILQQKFPGHIVPVNSLHYRFNPGQENENPEPPRITEKCKIALNSNVMITQNIRSSGLRNGEIGQAIEIHGKDAVNRVTILFEGGKAVNVYRMRKSGFLNKTRTLELHLPLTPAYALTYHKAQGQTLDEVFLNLTQRMEASLFFVGASRVRTKEGLRILAYSDKFDIVVDADVVAEYERLRALPQM
ncbi:hypothetical protein CRE_21826 [Caenorhabditis remanei]|uniref:ATP-dependent DNA helicase n=1 Tax=Caenorhabditis remanei TaxID=31234 RepID=E3MEP5_CAERE|nr:hypothetical protein CRE_21826 [Caenorhabditis remanei]